MKRAGTTATASTKSNNSIKKAANDIIDVKKPQLKKDSLPAVNNACKTGTGLWSVPNDKKSVLSKDEQKNFIAQSEDNTRRNDDFYNEVDKRMIVKLKQQVVDLSTKLENAMCKCSEAEYIAQRAENNRQVFSELAEKRLKELQEFQERQSQLEDNIKNLGEALTSAKKEISRLQTSLQVEEEKANNYYEMYQTLMLEKERRESTMSSEIHALSTQLNMFSRERENLVKVIQSSPNPNEITANFQRLKEEMEDKIKLNELQIGKLINESSEWKKKFQQEEAARVKMSDIVKKKNETIDLMKNEADKFKAIFEECKKEVKWNQNTVLQKENDIKVYLDKIKRLTEENSQLTKKYEKLKLSKGVPIEQQDEAPKAKPFLFGPETEEC